MPGWEWSGSSHCLQNALMVMRLTQPLTAKSQLYLHAVGLFLPTRKDENRSTGALTSCSGQMEFISPKCNSSRRRNTLISKPLCCKVNYSWTSCVHEAGYGTGDPDINQPGELKSEMLRHGRSLENHNIAHSTPGLNRPTLATGGQPLMSRGTRGHKSTTTVYNQLQTTTLKIMQWNAEGLVKKKTELEHILKEERIDKCCMQETNLKKDTTFKIRGYQCIRTDRAGDRNKGGVLTLVKLNFNAYLSDRSTDSAEYQVLKIKTKTKEIHLVNYYCPNNINLDLLNIPVVRNNFIIDEILIVTLRAGDNDNDNDNELFIQTKSNEKHHKGNINNTYKNINMWLQPHRCTRRRDRRMAR